MTFYLKLRRIIRDGEKLQSQRGELAEIVFRRRLKRLEKRLDALLAWQNQPFKGAQLATKKSGKLH
jgi:hypothetical protein